MVEHINIQGVFNKLSFYPLGHNDCLETFTSGEPRCSLWAPSSKAGYSGIISSFSPFFNKPSLSREKRVNWFRTTQYIPYP